MNRKSLVYLLGLTLVAGCASGAAEAEPTAAAPADATVEAQPEPEAVMAANIWDGVYTEDQAERGADVAATACFACHSEGEWANPMFIRVWSGRPIHGLWEQIRATMPYDSPGRLTAQEYSDIVAFILELNDVPAGAAELPAEIEGLQAITVTAEP